MRSNVSTAHTNHNKWVYNRVKVCHKSLTHTHAGLLVLCQKDRLYGPTSSDRNLGPKVRSAGTIFPTERNCQQEPAKKNLAIHLRKNWVPWHRINLCFSFFETFVEMQEMLCQPHYSDNCRATEFVVEDVSCGCCDGVHTNVSLMANPCLTWRCLDGCFRRRCLVCTNVFVREMFCNLMS